VLLVGFQAEQTRGRRLLEGAKELKLRGVVVPVRAQVLQMSGFSAHADWQEEERWLAKGPAPARVFLVHGEPAALETQRARLAARGWRVEAPQPGAQVDLA
jgi:metallo-beta-lactamase family protein